VQIHWPIVALQGIKTIDLSVCVYFSVVDFLRL